MMYSSDGCEAVEVYFAGFSFREPLAYVFKTETAVACAGELATRVNVLTSLQVVEYAVVALHGSVAFDECGKLVVLVLVFERFGYLYHSFEGHGATIPAVLFTYELLLAEILAVSVCRCIALFVALSVVGAKLLHRVCIALDENEIDTWPHFVAFGIGHVALHIVTHVGYELGRDFYLGDFGQEVKNLVCRMGKRLLVKVSRVDAHVAIV